MTESVSGLLRRWVVAVTAGESLAFCLIPALGGTIAWTVTAGMALPLRSILLYAVAIVAGLGEGAVLALFQHRVLATVFSALPRRTWVRGTALAASAAWAAGMLAPTLDDLVGLSPAAQVAIWLPASVFILLSIGVVQTVLLRPHMPNRTWRWAASNVVGWLGGLPWTFALPMLLPDDSQPWKFFAAMAVGGVLMGATVALVTGRTLVRFSTEVSAAAQPQASQAGVG